MSYWNYFPKAPSVAERKKQAEKLIAKLAKSGGCSPVVLAGKTISTSFWGSAWCKHIEGWQDHANRLERGRSYVRSGTVVDLRLEPGTIIGKVNGSSLYNVRIQVTELPAIRWKAFKAACFGQIGSLLDLLQGRMPELVLRQLTSAEEGLFPRTKEMKLACDCPDGAYMCKHVAAVLYGVGSRLDTQPELLFALRGVDHTELVAQAATAAVDLASQDPQQGTLKNEDLASIFGIELATSPEPFPPAAPAPKATTKKAAMVQVAKEATPSAQPKKAAPVVAAPRKGTTLKIVKKAVKKTVPKAVHSAVPKKAAPKKAAPKKTVARRTENIATSTKVVKKALLKRASKKALTSKTSQPKIGKGVTVQKTAAKKKPVTKNVAVSTSKNVAAPAKALKKAEPTSTTIPAPKKTGGRKEAVMIAKRGTKTVKGK